MPMVARRIVMYPKRKPEMEKDLKEDWFHNKKELEKIVTSEMNVLELGSYVGRSTNWFAEHAKLVYAVDHWLGSPDEIHMDDIGGCIGMFDQFLVNTWDNKDNIYPVRAWTVIGMRHLYNYNCIPDLIYVDAAHTYEGVWQDLEVADELFPEAIITGDDYSWGKGQPIKKAVERFCKAHNYDVEVSRDWFYKIIKDSS